MDLVDVYIEKPLENSTDGHKNKSSVGSTQQGSSMSFWTELLCELSFF